MHEWQRRQDSGPFLSPVSACCSAFLSLVRFFPCLRRVLTGASSCSRPVARARPRPPWRAPLRVCVRACVPSLPSSVAMATPRGLTIFISDIRNCQPDGERPRRERREAEARDTRADHMYTRACVCVVCLSPGTTKEAEQKRVDKELAHIRKQFGDKCQPHQHTPHTTHTQRHPSTRKGTRP